MPKRTITAADLFCGAGGTSSGLAQACKAMGFDLDLVAVNHWDIAIASHTANHAYARHECASIDAVDPRKAVPGGRLNLLVASPECTHHSNARGGRPMNDQSRSSAWLILRWAELLYIDNILIENVKEFRSWGPLGADGRPLKSKRGEFFFAFCNALKAAGYNVEHKVLNAADYGDPTTRERLFLIARRGNKKIIWPAATHAPAEKLAKSSLFTKLKPWVPARDIIDWKIEGKSIFNRKKPLAQKTLQRIYAGLQKFGGPNAEPFLIVLRQHMAAQSLDEPLPTLSAGGTHMGLVEPFMVPFFGERDGQQPRAHSVGEPIPTVTGHGAGALVEPIAYTLPQHSCGELRPVEKPLSTVCAAGAISLIEPQAFLIGRGGPSGSGHPQSIEEPLNTVLTENHRAVCEPFLSAYRGNHDGRSDGSHRNHSVKHPLPTQDCSNRYAVVEPVILNIDHRGGEGSNCRSADDPLSTITTKQRQAVIQAEAFLVDVNHGRKASESPEAEAQRRVQSVDKPLGTVTAGRRGKGVVEPCLVQYNGTATAQSVDEPMNTVTAKDRYALVTTEHGTYALDIRLRMLRPHELAAAMSFGKDYILKGKMEDQVKQIGNAVPVRLAQALCAQVIQ